MINPPFKSTSAQLKGGQKGIRAAMVMLAISICFTMLSLETSIFLRSYYGFYSGSSFIRVYLMILYSRVSVIAAGGSLFLRFGEEETRGSQPPRYCLDEGPVHYKLTKHKARINFKQMLMIF